MLNALCIALAGADGAGVERATQSFRRQGFAATWRAAWPGGTTQAWSTPAQRAAANAVIERGPVQGCCIGPIWYRNGFGADALRLLLEDIEADRTPDETALRGSFVLFLKSSRRCILANDLLGFARIYISADRRFYSTSWLATCAYTGQVEIDPAAAIEYVLLGAAHSEATLARGVTVLPVGSGVDLTSNNRYARPLPWQREGGPAPRTLDEAVEAVADHLKVVCSEVAAAFPSRIQSALSSGFDSRLILAGLLSVGADPKIFVYGAEDTTDVRVARSVAAALDRPIRVVDKEAVDRDRPLPDPERLVANALFFDGLPNDGILDRGSDIETRLAHTADGHIALSGGGGEILRNYFHLPDRRFTARELVTTFYRGFDWRTLRESAALPSYIERMAQAILRAVAPGETDTTRRLERSRIELAYPLFRCHHWMAVNVSVALRHGAFMAPLIDPASVAMTYGLPMAWKNVGRLEGLVIARLNPLLGQVANGYGYRFANGPNLHARWKAWLTRARPVRARPVINAFGRRARKHLVDPALLAHYRRLLPGKWRSDRWLDLASLPDNYAFARALAIETTWRELVD
jgi:asparagine synthase (glutamine-hydrolysing)